ncbi:regulatory protein RecX [Sphingosinicella sp.]|uniref:regulatory protein RecX n=1 Tax=Sphingosinicella sp. TaxID=1917971 RepID=UPI0035B2B513
MRTEKSRKPPRPLDQEALRALALRYVERFATSEGRLAAYLSRKVRERGWAGERAADIEAIVQHFAALRYVDDRTFGEARARGLERRGFGARRIGQDLRAAGLAEDLRGEITDAIDARGAAMAYARRKRFGPFAREAPDRAVRQKQFAAMLRAGHDARIAAEILDMRDVEPDYA